VLGLINPDYFLGGTMALDQEAAAAVIEERIGKPLGMDAEAAAAAIHQVVTENMAEAARVHSVEINVDIRDYGTVAFGGAGPIHGHGVAERLRLPFMVCPPEAGVLSALGLLTAPLAFEFSRSLTAELRDLTIDQVKDLLADLEARGQALLAKAGVDDVRVERSVDMCYIGQFYEVTTPVPAGALEKDGLNELDTLFNAAYENQYGRRLEGVSARTVTWRVLSSGPKPQVTLRTDKASETGASDAQAAFKEQRRVVFPDHGATDCDIYARERLHAGATLAGPALVEDYASTIAILPAATAEVDVWGNIIVRWQRE